MLKLYAEHKMDHQQITITNTSERTCKCTKKENCLLQEKCLTNNIMYKATLTSNQDTYQHKIY